MKVLCGVYCGGVGCKCKVEVLGGGVGWKWRVEVEG